MIMCVTCTCRYSVELALVWWTSCVGRTVTGCRATLYVYIIINMYFVYCCFCVYMVN